MPRKRKVPKSRVTFISVSRLYNCGNYENVKYDIGAEVPEGGDPKQTLYDLQFVIQHLKPIKRPSCLEDYERCLKKPKAEWTEWEKSQFSGWTETIEAFEMRRAQRQIAINMLVDLGGKSTSKDAKLDWDEGVLF